MRVSLDGVGGKLKTIAVTDRNHLFAVDIGNGLCAKGRRGIDAFRARGGGMLLAFAARDDPRLHASSQYVPPIHRLQPRVPRWQVFRFETNVSRGAARPRVA